MAKPRSKNRASRTPDKIRIHTLGQFDISVPPSLEDTNILNQRKPLELLKGLIALGGRNAQATQLAESIWPDTDGDQLYGTLTVNLNRLRKGIGHEAVELRDGRLHLNVALVWVDLWVLHEEMSLVEGALLTGDTATAAVHFENIMGLYRGPFLDGEFQPPEVLACRERTHGRLLRVIHSMGERLISENESGQAIRIFQRGLELDELAEELYQQLMRCFLEQGRFAEGLQVYERCRHIFHNSIGIDPASCTQALHYQLREEAERARVLARAESTGREHAPQAAERTASAHPSTQGDRPAPAPQAPVTLEVTTPAVPVAERLESAITPATFAPPQNGELAQDGELRPATVVHLHLGGMEMGREANHAHLLHEGLTRLKDNLAQQVMAQGGEVNQFVRNEAQVLFGIPHAHEDDSIRAVTAMMRFQEDLSGMTGEIEELTGRDLSLHIGIASGPVVAYPGGALAGRFELIGEPVDLADELSGNAQAGDVVICDQTRSRIEAFYHLEPIGSRGEGQAMPAFRVLERTEIDDRFDLSRKIGFTPYAGRAKELATLKERLDKVREGQGQFVTLAGEAGIGKSRILQRFQEDIPPGSAGILFGRCRPSGSNPPFRPISDALRNGLHLIEGHIHDGRTSTNQTADGGGPDEEELGRLDRELRRKLRLIDPGLEAFVPTYLYLLEGRDGDSGTASNPGGEPLRNEITEAVVALLTQSVARRPMVLLLEDWHWADEASDVILKGLINMVAEYPIFVAVSYRPEYEASWRNPRNHTHILLEALEHEQTQAIVQWMLGAQRLPQGLAELVHQRSEGNPYFIEEICQAMRGGGQLQVRDGEAFLTRSLDDLAVPDTVQAVVRARMDRINQQGRSVLRLAAVIGLEVPRTLLEMIIPEDQPLIEALETLQKMELLRMVRAYPDVVFRFNHAITQRVVYETILPSQRRLLHARVGNAYEVAYAERLLDKVEALAHHFSQSQDRLKAVQYLEQAGDKATHYFSLEEARRYYQKAVSHLNEGGQSDAVTLKRIDLSLKWGEVSFYHPKLELLEALEAANKEATSLNDNARILRTTFWAGKIHYALGRHRQAVDCLSRCLTMKTGGRDHDEIRALTISYLGRVHFYTTEFGPAAKQLEEGMERLLALGNRIEAINNMGILLLLQAFTGRFAEVDAISERMYAMVARETNPTIQAMAHVAHGLALLFKGDWYQANLQLAYMRRNAFRVSNPIMEGLALWGQGYGMMLSGEREQGIPLMHEGIGIIESVQSHYALTAFYGLLAIAYAEDGNREMGVKLARRSLEIKEFGGGQLGEFAAYCALALSTVTDSPTGWQNAQSFIDEALQVAEESGNRPGLAMTQYFQAGLLQQRGLKDKAESCRHKAAVLFGEMGMTYWLDKTKAR